MDIIPIDVPLDLPAPMWLLKFVLISFFLIHILFINFMIGGTFWTVFMRMLGKEDKFWERLAHEFGSTVTVNKSIAVVIGVAPLLAISLVYTNFFYPANNITAEGWLSIIWMVALAFVSLYVYKYTWDSEKVSLNFKYFWGLLAFGLFLIIPLVFLSNINLMLYPDQWKNISNFWEAIWVPNVLPRYLHFLNASFAVTGFFAYGYFHYKGKNKPNDVEFYNRAQKVGMKWALVCTALQMLFGVLNYVTLPQVADSLSVLHFILVAILFAGVAIFLLAMNLYADKKINSHWIFLTLLIVVSLMAVMRHYVRENALTGPKKILANKTLVYEERLAKFMETYSPDGTTKVTGEYIFQSVCTACHAMNKKVVGPAMAYAINKYKNDRDAMIQFVNNPRKVNPDLPVMPKPPITPSEVEMVVDYLLKQEVESGQ